MREAEKIEGGFNKTVMKEITPTKVNKLFRMPEVPMEHLGQDKLGLQGDRHPGKEERVGGSCQSLF